MKKILLLLVVMLVPMLASADVVEIDGIYYNLIEKAKEAEVTHGSWDTLWDMPTDDGYTGSVVIPSSIQYGSTDYRVTSIGEKAFYYSKKMTNISIPTSVKSIGKNAFANCISLTSISIPNSITSIDAVAFYGCTGLTNINIPNSVTYIGATVFADCSNLTNVVLPNGLTSISEWLFSHCSSLSSITIPDGVTRIYRQAFEECNSLKELIIPNQVKTIDYKAFYGCGKMNRVIIGANVNYINSEAFANCNNLQDVYCYAEKVPSTASNIFLDSYIEYAILHVPDASINLYKAVEPWKYFKEIVGLNDTPPSINKCEKPTISYENGQIKFVSATEGAEFVSEITDADIKKHYDAIISINATYNISVYATKAGYDNSDIAYATLCWIAQEPQTEGITDGINQIPSKALLIKNNGGQLTIEGADDGEVIEIYTLNGMHYGSAVSQKGIAHVDTNFHYDNVAVVKIGNKSIKVVIK